MDYNVVLAQSHSLEEQRLNTAFLLQALQKRKLNNAPFYRNLSCYSSPSLEVMKTPFEKGFKSQFG